MNSRPSQPDRNPRPGESRRAFLRRAAQGLCIGGLGAWPALQMAARAHGAHPLAPRPAPFAPKAKQLVVLFLTGGFSHVDTFDPKPALNVHHGKVVPSIDLRGTSNQPLLGSPFHFKRCGASGLPISELFPHLAGVADELCVIRSLHTDIVEHFQAVMAMHTGSATVPMPSLGAWLSFGLGTLNPNLPSHVVLAEHLPYAGSQVFDSNFLPPIHQGVRITPGAEPIPNLATSARNTTLAELEQRMLRDANEIHAAGRGGDRNLRARMSSFDIARGMMRVAPEALDVSAETQAIQEAYGVTSGDSKSFAWQCLVARRLVERGVRVVEIIDTGSHNNWDAHGNMQDHRPKARRVDQPIAALIEDLRRQGLLDETLIAICTEFGRTPWTDNKDTHGRNHYAKAFSSLLVGAGVKGGMTYGETDEFGISIVADPCHVHDYHATILHLMGIDHTQLTYRYAGRDFRLTDVSGSVMEKILA